jgi:hypothetical protein
LREESEGGRVTRDNIYCNNTTYAYTCKACGKDNAAHHLICFRHAADNKNICEDCYKQLEMMILLNVEERPSDDLVIKHLKKELNEIKEKYARLKEHLMNEVVDRTRQLIREDEV